MFTRHRANRVAGRIFFGLILLAIGITLTLDNLHVLHAREVFRYWPGALVVFGLLKMVQHRGGFGTFFWGIVTVLGGLLLASKLGYVHWNIWGLWPILLVLLGISTIFGAFGPRGGRGRCRVHFGERNGNLGSEGWNPAGNPGDSGIGRKWRSHVRFSGDPGEGPGRGPDADEGGGRSGEDSGGNRANDPGQGSATGSGRRADRGPATDSDSHIDLTTLFGGNERTIVSQDFRGGRISAIMGAVDLDLRRASIQSSPAELDVTAFWGGVQLRVPEDWTVVLHCSPVVGAAEDSTRKPTGGPEKKLIVRGEVIMGGIEIKN